MNDEETTDLAALEELDLVEIYQRHGPPAGYGRSGYLAHLMTMVADPDTVDSLRFCTNCSLPGLVDSGVTVNDTGWACDDCKEQYPICMDCDGRWTYYTFIEGVGDLCDRCLGANWFYCDDCEEHFRNGEHGEHRHDEDCGCEVFGTDFQIPNGTELLANDTSVKVTLPAGVISDVGLGAIANYLRWDALRGEDFDPDEVRYLSFSLADLGEHWQTREGNYTKRLSRMAYKKHHMKIPPEALTHVGNIARDHSRPVDFIVEVTRQLNLGPSEFFHGDSCWWQSYSSSRCALKSNGGYGIRTFGESYHRVQGRAWVMPLRYDQRTLPQFAPTFDALKPDALVVFNGYGNLDGYNAARLVAHMYGMTYRKIAFSCTPMYVNSGGYLVAPEAIAHLYTDQAISLSVPQHADLYEQEMETTNA